MQQQTERIRINEMIRARQVRVIDEEGEQLGIMSPQDAMREAGERELDLVEVAPKANPPVCRIMDYGKYRYQQSKRAKESKKHQHTVSLKEIKYRPKIDKHDFDYKTNHVRTFLVEGNKVRVTIMFRGREMAHPEFGRDILGRVVEATADLTSERVDASGARLEGRNMSIVLTPSKQAVAAAAKAAEAKANAGKGGDDKGGEDRVGDDRVGDDRVGEDLAPEGKAAETAASHDAGVTPDAEATPDTTPETAPEAAPEVAAAETPKGEDEA